MQISFAKKLLALDVLALLVGVSVALGYFLPLYHAAWVIALLVAAIWIAAIVLAIGIRRQAGWAAWAVGWSVAATGYLATAEGIDRRLEIGLIGLATIAVVVAGYVVLKALEPTNGKNIHLSS